jgi:hypothetical protein
MIRTATILSALTISTAAMALFAPPPPCRGYAADGRARAVACPEDIQKLQAEIDALKAAMLKENTSHPPASISPNQLICVPTAEGKVCMYYEDAPLHPPANAR